AYNYASGRLDHQVYYKSVGVDRRHFEYTVLDHLFYAWLDELALATDLLPQGPARLGGWPHRWYWDGHGHVDPLKEASAQKERLASYTTTLADEYAKTGQDWEAEIRQRAREVALMKELDLPLPAPPGQ